MVLSLDQVNAGVPFLPGRARYNIVTDRSSTWVSHTMATGAALDGTYTQTATQSDPTQIDPVVTGGAAGWTNLTHGGLFTMLADTGREILIEGFTNQAGATFSTVDQSGNVLRSTLDLSVLPVKLAPYETIKATGGATGGKVAFLVRYDWATIL